MNPFRYECICNICGGPGMGTTYTYFGVHKDPRVCSMYLEEKAEELRRATKELESIVKRTENLVDQVQKSI